MIRGKCTYLPEKCSEAASIKDFFEDSMEPNKYSFYKANTPEMIANMAAAYLGRYSHNVNHIGDEATIQETARVALLFYDNTRRMFLEKYTWSFALKELPLVEAVINPPDDKRLEGAHLKPQDLIRVLGVGHKSCSCSYFCGCDRFENTGHRILEDYIFPCGCGKVIRYIYDNKNLEQWSPSCIQALAILLARETAAAVIMDNSFQIYEMIDRAVDKAIADARGLDSYARDLVIKTSNCDDTSFWYRGFRR